MKRVLRLTLALTLVLLVPTVMTGCRGGIGSFPGLGGIFGGGGGGGGFGGGGGGFGGGGGGCGIGGGGGS
jgi:hypothetical protein